MGTKVYNIVAKLPIKVLPNIIREHNYGTINNMVHDIFGNVATLP